MTFDGSYKQKRFMFLIGQIPNWELYLTDKQLECAKSYISNLDTYMVDDKLQLRQGTSYTRLFGSKTSKGAIGKLEDVYIKLDNMGYFNKKENLKKSNNNKPILSDKTLNKVKELFKLITEIEDYGQYLTTSQNKKLYQFLQKRSFKECAKHFEITEITFKQAILGKDNHSGIFGKLKNIYELNHVNNWDDI